MPSTTRTLSGDRGRMCQREAACGASIGIPGPGPIPDEHVRVEVQPSRPLERALADANLSELRVVRPNGLEDRASEQVEDVALDL